MGPLIAGAGLALALAQGGGAGAAGSDPRSDWSAVWQDLARVRELAAGERPPEDLDALLEGLDGLAAKTRRDPRGRLLAAQLGRLRGRSTTLELAPDAVAAWPFGPAESWLAAEVHAPGPGRARAVVVGMAAHPGPLASRLRLAWEVGVEEALGLRIHTALAIQGELHARYQAAWSAMDLALTLRHAGRYGEADAVLAAQIALEDAAERPTGELWARRGIGALGSGDGGRARDYLGFGCARGSTDATVVLARLDLVSGRLSGARAGFRALLHGDNPSPWALRGWGLCLLPPHGSGGPANRN